MGRRVGLILADEEVKKAPEQVEAPAPVVPDEPETVEEEPKKKTARKGAKK